MLNKQLLAYWNKVSVVYASLISVVWLVTQSYRQLGAPRLTTDFISWALTSMAPVFGIGQPYTDYWGINPPGLILMTGSWGYLIGHSLRSFHILYLLCLALTLWLVWRILSQAVSSLEKVVLFTLFGLFFFHSSVQSQFFPSEINGFLFASAGLWLILRSKPSMRQIFWAHFLFIMAGQMKEVFALQGLALLPHVLIAWNQGWQRTRQYIQHALSGASLAVLVLAIYLAANGALGEYKAINQYKTNAFSVMDGEKIGSRIYRSIQYPRDRFFYARYQVPVFLFIGGLSALLLLSSMITTSHSTIAKTDGQTALTLRVSPQWIVHAVVVCYWFGATLGYAMQGRYGNKYDIEPILPLLLMLALSVRTLLRSIWQVFKKPLTPRVRIILMLAGVLITGILTFPHKTFLLEPLYVVRDHSFRNHLALWQKAESSDVLSLERTIASRTTEEDCITSVYGWGVGDTYYYAQRPSCSKYFLINILPRERATEYANELIDSPPKAIVYTHAGADLDTATFERDIFDFPTVIKQCYVPDSAHPTLFWRRSTAADTATCIKRYYHLSST